MKRKILIVIYIILILVILKLLYSTVINSILIKKYKDKEYDANQAKTLIYFNFSQSYVAHYNYGNVLYKNGEYEEAIEEYKKALEKEAPKNKRCNIRINYALSICKTVELDENDPESINNAIETYESAIDVLTEEGCANKNDNKGHSKKAEQLKKDIQEEIDRLKNLKKNQSSTDDNNNDEQQQQEEKNKTEQEVETIEEKIQNLKEEAAQDYRETEDTYNKLYNKNYNYNQQKNW